MRWGRDQHRDDTVVWRASHQLLYHASGWQSVPGSIPAWSNKFGLAYGQLQDGWRYEDNRNQRWFTNQTPKTNAQTCWQTHRQAPKSFFYGPACPNQTAQDLSDAKCSSDRGTTAQPLAWTTKILWELVGKLVSNGVAYANSVSP